MPTSSGIARHVKCGFTLSAWDTGRQSQLWLLKICLDLKSTMMILTMKSSFCNCTAQSKGARAMGLWEMGRYSWGCVPGWSKVSQRIGGTWLATRVICLIRNLPILGALPVVVLYKVWTIVLWQLPSLTVYSIHYNVQKWRIYYWVSQQSLISCNKHSSSHFYWQWCHSCLPSSNLHAISGWQQFLVVDRQWCHRCPSSSNLYIFYKESP
jgi:hypothetical protein